MEKRRLVNKTEMGKENFKRISSKQLEARITAFTVILAVIVMNILWWTGTQFLELNNNHNITETAKPFNQQAMQHRGNQHKKESRYPSSKIPGLLFSICYLIIVIKRSVHALHVLPSPAPAQYPPSLMDLR